MKKLITSTAFLNSLFFCILLFSSFTVEYSRVDSREDNPGVNLKEQRRCDRLERRKVKLEDRLTKAKNSFKRQRIQKKIRKIKEKQDNPTPVLGTLGLIFSIIGAALFFLMIIAFFIALFSFFFNSGINGLLTSFFLFIFSYYGSIIATVLGLIASITGLTLAYKNPDKFSGKKQSMAGLIISSIFAFIFLIFLLLAFL